MPEKNEVPEGWAEAKVSEICALINGRAFKPVDWANEGLPIVRIQNLNNQDAKFNFCNFEVDEKYIIHSGQLLFAWSGTPGTSFGAHIWENGDAVLNQHIFRVEINEKMLKKCFLKYALNYNISGYIENAHGTSGLAHITKGKFESSILLIPPLPEQHRIISAIEAIFSRLDAAEARLERVPEIMKKFRQSILAAACDGRLTEDWRAENPDVEDVKKYIEKSLSQKKLKSQEKRKNTSNYFSNSSNEFKYDYVSENWLITSMDLICTKITSGSRAWKKYYSEKGPGVFILSQNVRPLKLDLSYKFGVNPPENDPDRLRCEVLEGDLLITIAGNTGEVCRVRTPLKQHYVCQSVALVRPAIVKISPYLEIYLNSPLHGQYQYDKRKYGDGRPHLKLQHLRETLILLPPLPEQDEIVRRVDALFALADRIEERYAIAKEKTEKLRQSVLAQAFSGRLVETEAEIARREGRSYESAGELLERVRIGKGSEKASGKKIGKRK